MAEPATPNTRERFAPGLEAHLVPIGELRELEGNPRRGDLDAIERSYREFGQRRPIVFQTRDGVKTVLAGNHQLMVARDRLGWGRVAAVSADDLSAEEAQAFILADNRVSDLGTYDDDDLLALLSSLDDGALEVSGYSKEDVNALLEETSKDRRDEYSQKVESPIYEPKMAAAPPVADLVDGDKADELLAEIEAAADLPDEVASFLRFAAERHRVFKFDLIAEFYAHSEPGVQRLMENSALVIIDFDRALELGFVKLTDSIRDLFQDDLDRGGYA